MTIKYQEAIINFNLWLNALSLMENNIRVAFKKMKMCLHKTEFYYWQEYLLIGQS
jgi:hypothetical protein